MKKPFYKSRKFGYLLGDAIAGLLTIWVTFLVTDEVTRNLIFATYAIIQPLIWFVVWGIATEDKAALLAGSHPSQLVHGDRLTGDKVGDDTVSMGDVHGNVNL